MTKKEYREQLKDIELECEKKKIKLANQYCASISPYNKGDILVSLGGDIIEVEEVASYMLFGYNNVECKYIGRRLRKDLTSYKNNEKATIVLAMVDKKIER